MIDATIGGVSFATLGLGLRKHDIPPLPETKDYSLEIAGQDGALDFGSVYGPRTFNLDCVLMADDATADYQAKVAALASIFNAKRGDQALVFSDRPGVRYMGRYCGAVSIEKVIFDGNITIPIKMHDPFPESLNDTSTREYGQGLEYGQELEYSSYAVQITASGQSVDVENQGTADSYPLIRISGAFANLSLSDGFNVLMLTDTATSSDVYEIDCKPQACTVKKNAANAYAKSNGVFFALPPGTTTFTCTGSGLNIKIEFIFRHTYLY